MIAMYVTRRRLLAAASLTAALGGVGGSLTDAFPGGSWLRRHLGMTGEPGNIPSVPPGHLQLLSRYSVARHRQVELLIIQPSGFEHRPLPSCVALHPLGGSARGMADLGPFLTATFAQGARPVTIVAPDGARYWHDDGHDDDPMRMLTDELPAWLRDLGLPPPSGAIGISAGGFGALSYGLRTPMHATAVLSPALFTNWSDAQSLQAFPTQAEWAANDPMQHAAQLDGSRLGVWCGNADVFYDAAREFAARTHANIATFEPGDHTTGYWYRVLPAALRFLTNRLR
jgi:enterochelin esterase-like enzyme